MGLATHNPGGLVRFGVTAAAASAVLYAAVVLFGVNEASPSDVGVDGDRDTSVVHIRPSVTIPSVTVPSATVPVPLPAAPQLPGVSDLPG